MSCNTCFTDSSAVFDALLGLKLFGEVRMSFFIFYVGSFLSVYFSTLLNFTRPARFGAIALLVFFAAAELLVCFAGTSIAGLKYVCGVICMDAVLKIIHGVMVFLVWSWSIYKCFFAQPDVSIVNVNLMRAVEELRRVNGSVPEALDLGNDDSTPVKKRGRPRLH